MYLPRDMMKDVSKKAFESVIFLMCLILFNL